MFYLHVFVHVGAHAAKNDGAKAARTRRRTGNNGASLLR